MIHFLKNIYYWHRVNRRLSNFLKQQETSKILLFGYPKSGNTWLRFLIYNYRFLLLNPDIKKTITYDTLNDLQNNVMDRGTTFLPKKGYPLIYRTHSIFSNSYNLFDKKIFIHRNPLDTLISSYYFYKNRDISFLDDPENIRERLHDIDFYVLYKIDFWIKFYSTSIKYADYQMNYTKMKEDIETSFIKLLEYLDWDLDKQLVSRAIEISSFKKIKIMGEEKKQRYGNGPKDGSFKGDFTRSGEEYQFKSQLKEETINAVLEKFPDFNNLYPNIIE